MIRQPPKSALFPYATLYESASDDTPAPRRPHQDRSWHDRHGDLRRSARAPRRRTAGAAGADAARGHPRGRPRRGGQRLDAKSTRLNSIHANTPYAVFCLKKQSTTSSSSSTSSSSPSKQSDSIASSLGLTSTRADRPAS